MLAGIAREHGIPLVVDNTLASPYLCRPFEWGADIVIHSMTKFLGGHGTSMGGIVVESGRFDWSRDGKFPGLSQPDPAYHGLTFHETFGDFGFTMKARAVALRDLGPALSPTNAFNILTGIETLPLRMERHVRNALEVARFLEAHPAVAWVSYAGLESSPSFALAQHYLPLGAGSVFTFGLQGRLPGRRATGGRRQPLVAPRQRGRHPQPRHPSRLDHPPPADRRAAGRCRRRQRRHPPLRGHRDRRRPHRGPGPGTRAGLTRTAWRAR